MGNCRVEISALTSRGSAGRGSVVGLVCVLGWLRAKQTIARAVRDRCVHGCARPCHFGQPVSHRNVRVRPICKNCVSFVVHWNLDVWLSQALPGMARSETYSFLGDAALFRALILLEKSKNHLDLRRSLQRAAMGVNYTYTVR